MKKTQRIWPRMKKKMTDLAVRDKQKHQDNITRTKASFCMRSGWMKVFFLWKLKRIRADEQRVAGRVQEAPEGGLDTPGHS